MILETTAKASQQYKVMPIMISLLLAGFIGMFSETALNIALTDLMKELNITAATVQWLTTGYLLVLWVSLFLFQDCCCSGSQQDSFLPCHLSFQF